MKHENKLTIEPPKTNVKLHGIGLMSTWRSSKKASGNKVSGHIKFVKNGILSCKDKVAAIKKDSLIWVISYCKYDTNNFQNSQGEICGVKEYSTILSDSSHSLDLTLVKVTKFDGNNIFFDAFKDQTVHETIILNMLPYESDFHNEDNFADCSSENEEFEEIKIEELKFEIVNSPVLNEVDEECDEKDNSLDFACNILQPKSPADKVGPKLSSPIKDDVPKKSLVKLNKQCHTCAKCSKSFCYYKSLINHMKTHKIYNCLFCKETFQDSKNLKTHKCEKGIRCDICNKIISTKSGFQQHQVLHMSNRPKYKCPSCEKTFISKASLTNHERSWHKGQRFQCDLCNKIMLQKSTLRNHMKLHSGEIEKQQCTFCGKLFSHINALNNHIRYYHTKEKPFQCASCNKCFVTKSEVKRHMLTHTGEKPYCCEVCGSRFTASDSLVEHLRRHRGEKPFKCNFCEKAFSGKADWRKHIRIHTR